MKTLRSLATLYAELDTIQAELDELRYDDTDASQCSRLGLARDRVMQARYLVSSVEREYARPCGEHLSRAGAREAPTLPPPSVVSTRESIASLSTVDRLHLAARSIEQAVKMLLTGSSLGAGAEARKHVAYAFLATTSAVKALSEVTCGEAMGCPAGARGEGS